MFCTHCEFEIKGDDRKECPVCGGPLIDFSEVETSSEEILKALETDRWEETRNEAKETLPFDLGKALDADDEPPIREPQEHIPLPSQLETELEREAADAPGSTEEVLSETPASSPNLPGHVIAAAQQTALNPTHASRKQLAISVMAVLALVAAITTIAIFKPQQQVFQDIGHLKTKTGKTELKIFSMVTQREEKKAVAQKTPEQGTRVEQRQRKQAAGNVDPDKKRSRLGELSSKGKEKSATAKKQLKAAHHKPLAQEDAHHAIIASLRESAPPFVETDMQTSAMKPSTKNTLERKMVLPTPAVKDASQTRLYSLHTGSFKNKEVAIGEVGRLKKMGFHAYIQTVDLENGETWHRIKIGSYSTREEAENTQQELRQKVPTLESYIMRRVTEQQKTATEKKDETSIATAVITPLVSGRAKRELPHEKPDIIATEGFLKENFLPAVE